MKTPVERILEGEDVKKVLEDIQITTTAVAQMPGHKQYRVGPIHKKLRRRKR